MGHPVKKAMILAAGLGTRMAPVTDTIPKPLVPILNIPNIVHNLYLLKEAGIEEVVINAFHLGPKLLAALGDGDSLGVRLRYSVEEVLLGTGGGVKFAEPLLGNEPFVLCNSDLITDMDLNAAIEFHFAQNAVATMVLLDDAIKKRKYANVGTDAAGHLCQLPSQKTSEPVRTGIFTGIHILQPEIHAYLEPVFSGINQVLYPRLMREKPEQVFGYFAPSEKTTWLDTGEVPLFWDTSMKLLDDLQLPRHHLRGLLETHRFKNRGSGVWLEEGAELPADLEQTGLLLLARDCRLGSRVHLGSHVVIGAGASLGDGCRVERTVILPGSHVAAGAVVRDKIVFGNRVLPIQP